MVIVIDATGGKNDAYCIIHDNYFSLGFTCKLCVMGIKVNWFIKNWEENMKNYELSQNNKEVS